VLLQVACFVLGICFQSGGYIVQTSAGIIFFIKTFVTLFNQFIAYESVFYGWRWVLLPWSIYQLAYGLALIGGSIGYLIISQSTTSSDF